MRLIDADALKEKKVYSTERHEKVVPVAEIDWMPTVDAVPVRRGRWVNDSDGLPVCPFCDEVAMQRLYCDILHKSLRYDIRLEKTPYCPNCGADLREAEKDG